MALYEYQCESCSHRFELIAKFSDPPPSACPKCGGAVRKLVSSPAFQFKGSGWYVTDYARKPEASGSSKSGAKSETGDGGSKEASSEKSEKKDSPSKDAPAKDSSTSSTSNTTNTDSKKS